VAEIEANRPSLAIWFHKLKPKCHILRSGTGLYSWHMISTPLLFHTCLRLPTSLHTSTIYILSCFSVAVIAYNTLQWALVLRCPEWASLCWEFNNLPPVRSSWYSGSQRGWSLQTPNRRFSRLKWRRPSCGTWWNGRRGSLLVSHMKLW